MKPNHICKLSTCRKAYYACNYCDAISSYKSVACCKEHYHLYLEEVLANRAKGKDVNTLPERTDMTQEEIKALKQKPVSEVLEETKAELAEYADENGDINVLEAVDQINQSLQQQEE